MSETMDIGKKLVDFCQQKKHLEAVDALYDRNIVSIEAQAGPEMPARAVGIDAVREKNQRFMDMFQINSEDVKGPFPHGDRFIVSTHLDVTAKSGPQAGQHMSMDEAALYTVKDGKIVQEEFFYPPMGM